MNVTYHHWSNSELPHPSPLTRPKLLAPRYEAYNLFLHINQLLIAQNVHLHKNRAMFANLGEKADSMLQPEVVKRKTSFHAEGLCSPKWHFDCLIFPEGQA